MAFVAVLADQSNASTIQNLFVGGTISEYAYAVRETSDGGMLVGGGAGPFSDARVVKLDSDQNVEWVVHPKSGAPEELLEISDGYIASTSYFIYKLNRNGQILWNKRYADTNTASILSPLIKAGNGFVFARNYHDKFHILKIDAGGNLVWQQEFKTTGCARTQFVFAIRPADNRGYIAAGWSSCGLNDTFLLKLDANGNILWQKNYDIPFDSDLEFERTTDGGYILAADSLDGHDQPVATLIVKFKSDGGILWQKTYDVPFRIDSIRSTPTGRYLIRSGQNQILKLNPQGQVLWSKTYKVGQESSISDIRRLRDGKFAVAGVAQPSKTQKLDFWIFTVDSRGQTAGCITVNNQPLSQAINASVSLQSSKVTFRAGAVQTPIPDNFPTSTSFSQTTISSCE